MMLWIILLSLRRKTSEFQEKILFSRIMPFPIGVKGIYHSSEAIKQLVLLRVSRLPCVITFSLSLAIVS